MSDTANKEIVNVSLETEIKQSYLDYAMSVIVGRALPDVRDGLKPVHRRVLFAMHELGNDWNKPYKKSARIVGDVIGKYHPHGDTAVYDAIVRLAQPFSMRYLLVDGQGNFGSVDGDSPAAMRYTEIRMTQLTHRLLEDLDKETVDFVPNYDGNELAPTVLPARIPNLLINGSSGIAVGMATNIPPHNITEVINACLALIDDPNLTIRDLMTYIPGPDFPTAAIINGRSGILEAYHTGRGRIYVRAKSRIEDTEKKQAIIIDELPYQVNKARLLEKIAELVKLKKIEGITAIRDESDKQGMRMVIEVRRGDNAEVVLNNLYMHTQLQIVFGINMVALDQGQPKLFTLKRLLETFIDHRREVVTRRSWFLLRKARERAHLLEGLAIALANIDEMITLIKTSGNPAEAKEKMLTKIWQAGDVMPMLQQAVAGDATASRPENLAEEFGLHAEGYRLTAVQAQAILDLRLHRLTGLEQDKIISEYKELLDSIKELLKILSSSERLMEVIREELVEMRDQYGDQRLTEIIDDKLDLNNEDLIEEETVVLTISQQGYAKSQTLDTYQAQHRGGRGKSAASLKEEDFVANLIIASTHDVLLCFTNLGRVYWLKSYQIPQAGRTSRGRPLVNILPLQANENISAILPIKEFTDHQFVIMATAQGTIKKTSLVNFSRPRASGIIAIDLKPGDDLIGVNITDGNQDIMLFSNAGKVIRFTESALRPIGRTGAGVRGIRLQEGQQVIALIIAKNEGAILTATANGYGKRTEISEYRQTGRGGQGVISIQCNERNGDVIAAQQVLPEDEVILVTDGGTLVRIKVAEISLVGRNTQGVRLINLSSGEKLIKMQRVVEIEEVSE